MLPEQQQRILGYFIEEAKDHLNTIEQGLLNLQSTLSDPEMINEVFRAAHSIKGGAAMLGLNSIQRTAHRLEDCFKVLKEHPVQIDQKLESMFLGVSDTLKALLEHLQAPFGLTEEVANTLMSEAEPVFGWLYEHLEMLVKQGGNDIVMITPPPEEPKPAPTPQLPSQTEKWQVLQNQVMQKLREMLQFFKQTATPENRQQLQQSCQELIVLGEKWNLSHWCNLCQAISDAIVNPENTYLSLAKIVITEIKQALELVVSNREDKITISQQLDALLPIPKIESLGINTDFVQLPLVVEQRSTSGISFDIAINTEEVDIDFQDNITNLHHEEPQIITHANSSGPEVGSAELNTLAQLFEKGAPDFNDWEIEQQHSNLAIDEESRIDIDGEINENDSEIRELLLLEKDDEVQEPQTITTEYLSLVDLLDNFSEENLDLDLESIEYPTEYLSDANPEQIVALDTNINTTSQDDFDELFTNIGNTKSQLSSNSEANFEELFTDADDINLAEPYLVDSFEEFAGNFPFSSPMLETELNLSESETAAIDYVELSLPDYQDISQIDENINLVLETDISPFDDLFDVLPLTSAEFTQNFWEEDEPVVTRGFNQENLDINQYQQDTDDNLFAMPLGVSEQILSQQPEILESTPEFTNLSPAELANDFDTIYQDHDETLEIDFPVSTVISEVSQSEFDELPSAKADININDLDEAFAETSSIELPVFNNTEIIYFDEFADLEALLEEEAPKEDFEKINSVDVVLEDIDDPFSDLENLLEQADKSILSSQSVKSSTIRAQRPVNRRPNVFEHTMRVSVKHLDEFSNLVGELVVNRNTLEQDQERLRQSLDNLLIQVQQLSDVGSRMQDLYERSLLEASLLASRKHSASDRSSDTDRGFSELEMDRFTPFHSLSQEMIELIVRVRESASDIDFVTEETERVTRQFRQVGGQLQEGLTRARMVPFAQATDRLQRGVRDNAIKCGKQVELVIEGRDTLIDKMLLEHLTDPLTHMLNNAIAHGIEQPESRISQGKKPVGVITIRAFHQGNQTVIAVKDDGVGINPEWVKTKAIDKGLITSEEGKNMSRVDIYDLLFQPGFSTADQVDDLKGRGVGMDVVRTSISEIRGTITIDSTIGKGTIFTIRLPLTLSICKALCCVSDKARIAFPMDGVEDTLDIPSKQVQYTADGRSYISWRDTMLPFRPLKELLSFNRQLSRGNIYGGTRDDDMYSVLVVRSGTTLIALQVDQFLNEQEIVIKQFEGPAPKPVGVAGATVLGDGRIMPIADVLEIIEIFQGRINKQNLLDNKSSVPIEKPSVKIDPTVLIIDDSITVRELLSLTFNKAGYRVEQARDGQEAWEKLRSGLPCDIVFCDIEMPRCDGLELLSRIQKEASLSELPIAMLTSRGADKHRQMAIELGASGYFTKPYLEEALLDAASRILRGEKLLS